MALREQIEAVILNDPCGYAKMKIPYNWLQLCDLLQEMQKPKQDDAAANAPCSLLLFRPRPPRGAPLPPLPAPRLFAFTFALSARALAASCDSYALELDASGWRPRPRLPPIPRASGDSSNCGCACLSSRNATMWGLCCTLQLASQMLSGSAPRLAITHVNCR